MVKTLFPSLYYVSDLYGATLKATSKKDQKRSKSKAQKISNKELLEEISKIRAVDIDGQKWSQSNYWGGYTSYGSWDQLHKFSTTFEVLEKQLQIHVAKFVKELHWDINPKELVCDSMWTNIMPEGTSHSFHIHPLSVISGTYYVDVPGGAPGIQFEDPRHGLMMATPPRKKSSPAEEKPHFTHKSKAGEVVLFESWMKHQVPPNSSKKARVSISFNYRWVRS